MKNRFAFSNNCKRVLCACVLTFWCATRVQVKATGLKRRRLHSATSCCISSGLNEIILFGGQDKYIPALGQTIANASDHTLADTTVLRFGESIIL